MRGPVRTAAILVLGSLSCSASAVRASCEGLALDSAASRPASVVLVVADTLRRDRPGAYGGPAKTPRLDAFAREHLLFENASSQAPWTKPSVATLFTSLYPSQHRVASDPQLQGAFGVRRSEEVTEADVLSDEFVTLAEAFRAAGLRTAAVVPNPWMLARYGFAQGFEHYDDSLASFEAGGVDVSRAALDWLETLEKGQRYLLYVHYMDPHRPYGRLEVSEARSVATPPGDDRALRPRDAHFAREYMKLADGRTLEESGVVPTPALVERAYDRGVENFDRALGLLLEGLRAREDWGETAVVLTSDHGEGLFEHGYGNHGGGLFEEETAIPLVVRWPGARPLRGRLACLVGLVDWMPSLCDGLGIACPETMSGRSVFGPAPAREFVISEGVMTRPANRSIRSLRHKLIYEPEGRRDDLEQQGPWSFYSLSDDPRETHDLIGGESLAPPARLELDRLKRALRGAVADFEAPKATRAPLDAATRERLRALGYDDESAQ